MKNLISIFCLLVLFGFEAAAQCSVSIAASNNATLSCTVYSTLD